MVLTSASASGEPLDASERNQLFMKTKLCKFEQRGLCTKGSSCCFAHNSGELRGLPDLRFTKLCAAFVRGDCDNSNCNFAHSKQELRTTGRIFKTKRAERLRMRTAVEPTWTPQLSFEDMSGGSEASLDVSSCPSSGPDAADYVNALGHFWGAASEQHLDLGGFGYPVMDMFALAPLSGPSDLGHSMLAEEPAYVPLHSSLRTCGMLMDTWDETALHDSILVDPSNDVWKVQR
mmetsp:Transcript_45929/g.133061  ORF Transcript_45929/g.133061 Transcript_45929/m.133061 type:complete len:233 (+) Transcript_45929:72-770(+)